MSVQEIAHESRGLCMNRAMGRMNDSMITQGDQGRRLSITRASDIGGFTRPQDYQVSTQDELVATNTVTRCCRDDKSRASTQDQVVKTTWLQEKITRVSIEDKVIEATGDEMAIIHLYQPLASTKHIGHRARSGLSLNPPGPTGAIPCHSPNSCRSLPTIFEVSALA